MSDSVTRTTTHVLLANVSKNVALFAVLLIIPRFYGSTNFGAFSLALAVTTPFYAFALIGARILRLTGPKQLSTKSIELSLLITGALALVSSLLFTQIFRPDASTDSAISILGFSVFAVAIYKWGDLFTELFAGELQRDFKTGKLLFVSISSGAVLVAAAYFLSILKLPFQIFLTGIGIAGILSALIFKFSIGTSRSESNSKVSQTLKLGLPLGLAGAIGTLMSTTPQYFVAAFYGPELVGVLAVILYVFSLADLFGAAYAQAWVHKIKERDSAKGQIRFALKIGVISSFIFIPISIIGVWLFSMIAPLIFGIGFIVTLSEALPLVIAVSLLPLVHMVSIALLVRIAYKQSLFIMLASAISVVILSTMLVPTLGITGALLSVMVGTLVRVLAPLVLNRDLLGARGI